jgi:FkbM family methyltransferase
MDYAFPRKMGSGEDAFVGLIETANREFPGFIDKVVDGGSGIGSFVDRVLQGCPFANIVAYEPLPENAEILRSRFGVLPSVDIREAALGDRLATVQFDVPVHSRKGIPNSPWAAGTSAEGAVRKTGIVPSLKRLIKKTMRMQNREAVSVRMCRLDSDLSFSPDVVKLDLQGGEPEALQGMGDLLTNVKVVKIEVEMLTSGREVGRCCIHLLRDAGFHLFVEDLQFAVPELTDRLRGVLTDVGIEITRETRLYGASDRNVVVIGKWLTDRPLPIRDLEITPEFAEILTASKAEYFQVDLVALNTRYVQQWKQILPPEFLQ